MSAPPPPPLPPPRTFYHRFQTTLNLDRRCTVESWLSSASKGYMLQLLGCAGEDAKELREKTCRQIAQYIVDRRKAKKKNGDAVRTPFSRLLYSNQDARTYLLALKRQHTSPADLSSPPPPVPPPLIYLSDAQNRPLFSRQTQALVQNLFRNNDTIRHLENLPQHQRHVAATQLAEAKEEHQQLCMDLEAHVEKKVDGGRFVRLVAAVGMVKELFEEEE